MHSYNRSVVVPRKERFYTKIEGRLNYGSWLEGVRAGKTFVTNGPILEFRVDDADIGEELSLDSPGPLTVAGSVIFDRTRDYVDRLELIENGRVVRSFPRTDDSGELSFRVQHPVQETGWLALRASGTKVGEVSRSSVSAHFDPTSAAHTAPVYVALAGSPALAQQPRALDIMGTWLARLEDLEARLSEEKIGTLAKRLEESQLDLTKEDVLRRDRAALIEEIRKAKEFFSQPTG